jgi:uncharacterized protein
MRVAVIIVGLVLSPAASAASFACAKATSPLERAICGNAALSAADEDLARAYADGLRKLGDAADILRRTQRVWLLALPDTLARRGVDAVLRDYRDRTEALQAIPDFPKPDEPVEGATLDYTNAPRGYDLTLRFLQACGDDGGACLGPAQLVLRPAGKPDVVQVINIPAAFMNCSLDEATKAGTTQDCGTQPLVDVQDYNFDGTPDIAVTSDEAGGYGAYGSHVFLFDPARRRFVFNAGISALTVTLTFELDPATKRIKTEMKSGAGYHEDTVYRLDGNKPVPVSRHIGDADIDPTLGQRKITDSRWVNGRWVDTVRIEK